MKDKWNHHITTSTSLVVQQAESDKLNLFVELYSENITDHDFFFMNNN